MALVLRSTKGSALTANEVDGNFLLFPRLIASSGARITNTGNTTENTIATIAIPANSMGPNGFIRITSLWTTDANTNTKTMRIKFNGTTYQAISHTTAATIVGQMIAIIRNRNATNSQVGMMTNVAGIATGQNGANVTSAHDTTGALNLTITAQCTTSGSDSIHLEGYTVEVCYAP